MRTRQTGQTDLIVGVCFFPRPVIDRLVWYGFFGYYLKITFHTDLMGGLIIKKPLRVYIYLTSRI
jgi:hypothetical protein